MTICQVVPSLEERHGGPSRSVHDLSVALATGDNRVDLLSTTPGRPGFSENGPLTIRSFHRDRPVQVCRSKGLAAYLESARADVVHHHSLWLRTLHYAHRSASRQAVPLVVSPRGMMSEWAWNHHRRRKQLARLFLHPGAFEAVTGWHATSDEEAAEIRARGFTQPICIAPNGVAEPSPEAFEGALERWRQICPAAENRPVALFYSRFHRKKRVLELIDLWLECGPPDWLLLLVGIPQEYTPDSLEDYIDRQGGDGRILAFSGAGRPPPYAIASLFLLPSHNENFGLVIGEALAHGVPALVTDTTPWSGLNARGAGWCVPWAEYGEALRAATSESRERLRERGAIGRRWAVEEMSWRKPAESLRAFYASLRR